MMLLPTIKTEKTVERSRGKGENFLDQEHLG